MADKDDKKTIQVFFDSSGLTKAGNILKGFSSSVGKDFGSAISSYITRALKSKMPSVMGAIGNNKI